MTAEETDTSEPRAAATAPATTATSPPPAKAPIHVLVATWLGGVFDGMDSSIFAIVLYPALSEILGTKSHAIVAEHGSWIVALFMFGWAFGAMFFGTLADYIGRARTMTLTILLYACCTGLCALAHTWWELGIYRFLVGAGIGGEMGIGAVYLSECWPNKSRAFAVGLMATSLGFGYLLTALLNLELGHLGWRWLFVAGIAPAFLTVYIRSKLKESDHFHESKSERTRILAKAEHERTDEEKHHVRFTMVHLFNRENLRNTVMVSILACVAIICWWAVLAWIPAWVNQLTGDLAVEQRSHAMFAKDAGMILSGLIGGWMIKKFGYKAVLSSSMALAFFIAVGMFSTVTTFGPALLCWIGALGLFAHLPFVVLWMYIPELFVARIRSTAFGFSYNIGRVAAAFAVLASGVMIHAMGGSYAKAASVVASVYIFGAVAALFMPKTSGQISK